MSSQATLNVLVVVMANLTSILVALEGSSTILLSDIIEFHRYDIFRRARILLQICPNLNLIKEDRRCHE